MRWDEMFLRSSGPSVSKEFYDLIKAIGETRSKQDEDLLLDIELGRLMVRFRESTGLTNVRLKELVIRALYCFMLGHDIEFCVIQGLSLSSDKDLWCKRTGYLMASQAIPESSELLLLSVNTIQKDLQTSNHYETCAALNIIANKVHAEAVPVLLPSVIKLIEHPRDIIRKKALCALTHILQKHPLYSTEEVVNAISLPDYVRSTLQSNEPTVILCLVNFLNQLYTCLQDSSIQLVAGTQAAGTPAAGTQPAGTQVCALTNVMSAQNTPVHNPAESNPTVTGVDVVSCAVGSNTTITSNMVGNVAMGSAGPGTKMQLARRYFSHSKALVPQLVATLKNVIHGRMSDQAEYHRIPAPWLQIRIMRLLVALVKKNPVLSQECYDVLRQCLTEPQNNISFAVQYECILTIASIYPHANLCRLAAQAIGTFVESNNRNLRLAGLNGLTKLVEIDPAFIQGHQLTIIDSLEDLDETIRTKTLQLLAQSTTSTNVLAVVDKLIASAEKYYQSSLRKEMVRKCYELIDRFAPTPDDYILTMCRLMKCHPRYFDESCGAQFVSVVGEGPANDDQDSAVDDAFRKQCVECMLEVLDTVEGQHGQVLVACVWALCTCAYTIDDQFPISIPGAEEQEEWDVRTALAPTPPAPTTLAPTTLEHTPAFPPSEALTQKATRPRVNVLADLDESPGSGPASPAPRQVDFDVPLMAGQPCVIEQPSVGAEAKPCSGDDVDVLLLGRTAPGVAGEFAPSQNGSGENHLGENHLGENHLGENHLGENPVREKNHLQDKSPVGDNRLGEKSKCARVVRGRRGLLERIVNKLWNCYRELVKSHQRVSVVQSLVQLVALLERPVEAWWGNVAPLVSRLQANAWSVDVDNVVQEFLVTSGPTPSGSGLPARSGVKAANLYPVFGYTEDVTRYTTMEAIENCIKTLGVEETSAMKDLVHAYATQRQGPTSAEENTLHYSPYEDNSVAASAARRNQQSAQQCAADFAVRSVGSRWTINGLKAIEKHTSERAGPEERSQRTTETVNERANERTGANEHMGPIAVINQGTPTTYRPSGDTLAQNQNGDGSNEPDIGFNFARKREHTKVPQPPRMDRKTKVERAPVDTTKLEEAGKLFAGIV
ncbi:adaptin amine-terminal region protein [Gregarina niphandrodes]|uniref:Adaptin amine-terminal region protein n=1 Tax=Gregarina niphandrodes TaxID=110365 RepID=A0A023BB13_GRENI|nr:adaptin amine-terminal region protein [Gregarina niphandrodes]EZG78634.1 adaptin amine-terminal region protein [Gregarina niphandrodes]|eukprot:XP_011129225.1 adaptin amine-terminal region protein [Gregarina niphandrodes]